MSSPMFYMQSWGSIELKSLICHCLHMKYFSRGRDFHSQENSSPLLWLWRVVSIVMSILRHCTTLHSQVLAGTWPRLGLRILNNLVILFSSHSLLWLRLALGWVGYRVTLHVPRVTEAMTWCWELPLSLFCSLTLVRNEIPLALLPSPLLTLALRTIIFFWLLKLIL